MNQGFGEMLAALSGAGAGDLDLWGRPVPVIGREDLIASKRAAGRPQDLADIAALDGALVEWPGMGSR